MGNKKYTILIVGYEASLLQILPLVKHLKKENPFVDIHLLTNRKMDSITIEINEYVSRVIQIKSCKGRICKDRLGSYINKFLFLFPFIFLSFKKYDIVNIHFAKPQLLKAMPWLKKVSKNIVITPWGSDVLRLDDENAIKRMQKVYSYASCVTCDPKSHLAKAIVEKFKYDSSKIRTLRFGADFFDYVNEVKPNLTTDTAKKRFHIDGRYVITCGYSTAPSHRHGIFIDTMNAIKSKLPNNLTLLFPFTYGWGTPQYIQSIKDKCKEYNLDAVYVQEFLSMEDLYTLRMATDLYVNIQTTDAGATSIMQYFVCNKKVVHGEWLEYQYLQGYEPSFYFPIRNIDELGDGIIRAYLSDDVKIPETIINKLLAKGWNSEIKHWNNLFLQLAENTKFEA